MRVLFLLLALTVGSTLTYEVTDLNWLETALIYQIYPRSFKDSDGDGIGDLNGITSKLPFLQNLGVDAIWLSPIFLSPMYDFGYDITDYREIAPEYGTMEDFDTLLETSKGLGIRVILDLVPNHTSNESDWFVKSARREEPYEDWYVWADGVEDPETGELGPPNNWISVFRKSAWEYNSERGQYYLHQFVIGQPDLNYREPAVQEEMKDVVRFWLDKGVSGFRVDAINMMYEVDPADFDGHYPDEPLSGNDVDPEDYEYLNHVYTKDLAETYEVVYDWRDVLDEYIHSQGERKIMMTEAYTDLDLMMRYYGSGGRSGSYPFNFAFLGDINNQSNARDVKMVIDKWMTYLPTGKPANWVNMMTEVYTDLDLTRARPRYNNSGGRAGSYPFNFAFLGDINNQSNARDVKMVIDKWMTYLPTGKPANWVNGNHDQSRLASRLGTDRVDAMNMLALLLPGVALTYQGEELGMTDGFVSWEDTVDPQACNTEDPVNYWKKSRDPNRTPYQWDSSPNAGFTTGDTTWLPVASNYEEVNLEVQEAVQRSHYHFYRDVARVRRSEAVRVGDLDTRTLVDNVLVVTRLAPGTNGVVAIANLANYYYFVDLNHLVLLPEQLRVVASGVHCTQEKNTILDKRFIILPGHCALVLQTVRNCC